MKRIMKQAVHHVCGLWWLKKNRTRNLQSRDRGSALCTRLWDKSELTSLQLLIRYGATSALNAGGSLLLSAIVFFRWLWLLPYSIRV